MSTALKYLEDFDVVTSDDKVISIGTIAIPELKEKKGTIRVSHSVEGIY